jgi:hypothetical protein
MKVISSHWRLAYRAMKKAIKVTIDVLLSMVKSKMYSVKVEYSLIKQRTEIKNKILGTDE